MSNTTNYYLWRPRCHPRASLYVIFVGVLFFCIVTLLSYVQIHFILQYSYYTFDQSFRHYAIVEESSSHHPPPHGGIVVKHESPAVVTIPEKLLAETQKHQLPAIPALVAPETNQNGTKLLMMAPEKQTKSLLNKTEMPFVVDGWPAAKSRIATDYIDYEKDSARLVPIESRLDPPEGDVESRLPRVLIAVQSAPGNTKQRQEVRQTWGTSCSLNQSDWCSMAFVIGDPQDPDEESLIEEEHAKHGDILQESFLDSYNNLTLKSIHILKHFVIRSANDETNFLLKTDDDSYVHTKGLYDLVQQRLAASQNKTDNLIGFLQLGQKRHHYLPTVHKPSKTTLKIKLWRRWLVPSYMYPKKFFPQFLSGSGYLISRNAASCLLEKSKVIPIIHLEDVYITGLCAARCHFRREHHRGFKARKLPEDYHVKTNDVVLHYMTGRMAELHKQTPVVEKLIHKKKNHKSKAKAKKQSVKASSTLLPAPPPPVPV